MRNTRCQFAKDDNTCFECPESDLQREVKSCTSLSGTFGCGRITDRGDVPEDRQERDAKQQGSRKYVRLSGTLGGCKVADPGSTRREGESSDTWGMKNHEGVGARDGRVWDVVLSHSESPKIDAVDKKRRHGNAQGWGGVSVAVRPQEACRE